MKAVARIALILSIALFSLTAPAAGPALAATGCTPGAGQVSVFEGLGYAGNCATKAEGSYDTANMGVGNNTIDSIKIGGVDSNGYAVRLLGCQDAAFGGACTGYKSSGDIPVYPDPTENFRNTISSFRVQPYNTSNTFLPTWSTTFYFSDGTPFHTKQCTWGTADKMHSFAGIWPGWRGNAEDWAINASAHHYLVNDTPAWSSILQIDDYNSTQVASGWSGAMNGGNPVNVQNWSNRTGQYGHVAWIVDVRTAANGVTWLHTVETNVNVSGFNRANWTVETNSNGIQWLHIYQRFNATDKANMAIIHVNG